MGSVIATAAGDAAIDTLRRVLAERRDDDPLSPALVVCAQPLVAVGVRRALGASPSGIAGVDVITSARFIERLSETILAEAGQHEATTLELQAAIRAELAADPGRFGAVAAHRTTEERLLGLHRQVIGLTDDALDRLGRQHGLPGDAIRVLRGAKGRLGRARAGDRVLEYAIEQLDATPSGSLGPILVFLPEPTRPDEGRLLRALHRRDDVTVMVGLTGHDEVDRRHRDRLSGWGVQLEPGVEAVATTARRVDVSDPDDEVRAAIRLVSAHAASGVPLSQMAVLHPAADPYASLLEDQLNRAGLPHGGPGHRSLRRSLAGRTLLRLLSLQPVDASRSAMERARVINLVVGAPVRDTEGRPVPTSAWDRLSKQAGVIDDDDWTDRLTTFAAGLPHESSDRMVVAGLLGFVDELRERLRPDPAPTNWWEWGRWGIELLRRYAPVRPDWPDAEQVAAERVVSILERLRTLDRLHQAPDLAVFVATIEAELEAAVIPGTPVGSGLVVAPIGAVSGLGFHRVIVVGAADGVFPRVPREDSLLPDQARALTDGMVQPIGALTDLDVRSVAMALAGSRLPPVITSARGDLRSNRARLWPRNLEPLVDDVEVLESHHHGLVHHGRPASIEDLALRSLITHVDRGEPIHSHPHANNDPILAVGLTRSLDRQRATLTSHSGRVRTGAIDPASRLLSPTALEDYATCPRRYLFGRVLRIGEDERPERIDEITARDRGSLVHDILDRFLAAAIEHGSVPAPDDSWPATEIARLRHVTDQALAEAARRGITGGRVQTVLLGRALVKELLNWVADDNRLRAERRSTPYATELAFGFDDDPGHVALSDGRALQMRGAVDRVDLTDDDGLLVIDYKGGSNSPFRNIADDPLKGGRRLQLPLYARVVADRLDRHGPRTALYWLTKSSEFREIALDDDLEDQLEVHVGAALSGIGAGLFPGLPGVTTGWPRLGFENCTYCDFDRICPSDRQAEWDRVQFDDALTPIDVLLGRVDEQDRES